MSALSSDLRRCSCELPPVTDRAQCTNARPIITARLDWADIGGGLARPALRPRQPQHGLAGRHARPPPGNCVDDPCYPPLHAPHRAPQLGPSRRRALRAARCDVCRRRGHPLSRARAAGSRGGLEAARHACRSLGAGRLRQLRMHREDVGAFVGRCGPWFPEGWPALEIGYSFQREFWGTRIRVGGGESVRALRVRRVAGARRHQPGASGQPPPQRVAERGRATVEREMVVRGLPVRVFLWPQH